VCHHHLLCCGINRRKFTGGKKWPLWVCCQFVTQPTEAGTEQLLMYYGLQVSHQQHVKQRNAKLAKCALECSNSVGQWEERTGFCSWNQDYWRSESFMFLKSQYLEQFVMQICTSELAQLHVLCVTQTRYKQLCVNHTFMHRQHFLWM
jgi:hypothetical protein